MSRPKYEKWLFEQIVKTTEDRKKLEERSTEWRTALAVEHALKNCHNAYMDLVVKPKVSTNDADKVISTNGEANMKTYIVKVEYEGLAGKYTTEAEIEAQTADSASKKASKKIGNRDGRVISVELAERSRST